MYKINEVFETIQGEGTFTGVPAIFVRLQVCPVGCSWCDTKQTWDAEPTDYASLNDIMAKKGDSPLWTNIDAQGIVTLLQDQGYTARHVVITGGEPCMVDLTPLCAMFENNGYSTQIETSGTFEIITTEKCWVTVSPKVNMRGGYEILSSAMHRANEIKHPIATEQHVTDLKQLLAQHKVFNTPVYLQPISQKERATQLAIDTCIENNWRLSIQVHKYIGIE